MHYRKAQFGDAAALAAVHVRSWHARQFYEHLGAHFIAEETLDAGEDSWKQCAYGWNDVTSLTSPAI